MKAVSRWQGQIAAFALLLVSLLAISCGTLEVGLERTATATATATQVKDPTVSTTVPPQTLVSPTATPTATPGMAGWATHVNPGYGISLRYPAQWLPVQGDELRHEGGDGFFAIDAIGNPQATIDDIADGQAGHRLRPYGAQPTIEPLNVHGQEARLILPSADANMGGQAMLIVRYPVPVQLGSEMVEFFALYADQDHIRDIAQSLRFDVVVVPTATATPSPSGVWENLPPGLVYRLLDKLWLANADGQPMQISSDPEAVLSPTGTRLLSYNLADNDPWVLDLSSGTGWKLASTSEREECCFRWWKQRLDVVMMHSMEANAPRGPGVMGYLTTANADGTEYRVLDAEHDAGPGGFSLSPDGRTIAYGGGNTGWLYRWETGPEVFDPVAYGLTSAKGVGIGSPSWSPDGTKLAWIVQIESQMGIGLFDIASDSGQFLYPYQPLGRDGWPPAPAWSPDGRWLALLAWSQDPAEGGVWVVRVDGQQGEKYVLGWGSNPVWSPDGHWLAFDHSPQGGEPGIWVAEQGTWDLFRIGLPPEARLAGWIDPPQNN